MDKSRYRATVRPLAESLLRVSGTTRLEPIVWAGEKCYLYQVPLALFGDAADDLRLPSYVPSSPTRARSNVWVGEAGNLTPTHVDFEENVLVQVAGVKDVLLWDADQYPRHHLHALGTPHEIHAQVDVTDPDLERWPDFADSDALLAHLEPGDGLYIPFDALHCVCSVTSGISTNFWWGSSPAYRATRLLSSPLIRYCVASPVPFVKTLLRQPDLAPVRRFFDWPKEAAYLD